jgi:multidrug efflux pump subunit AcrA (membrane-fusion protein)
MKKSVLIIMTLLFIILGCSVTVVLMATGIIEKASNEDNDVIVFSDNDKDRYILYVLSKRTIDITENSKAVVSVSENAKKTYTEENVNGKFIVHVKVGEKVKKGNALYTDSNGTTINAENDLIITNINLTKNFMMEVFCYTDSKLVISIMDKYQDNIDNLVFTTKDDNDNEIVLELSRINPTVSDGRIEVELKNPFELMENSIVDVKVKYDKIENKISIPADYVFFSDTGKPYIHIIDGEDVSDHFIDVYMNNDTEYIVNDGLDGTTIGYTLEEKYFDN